MRDFELTSKEEIQISIKQNQEKELRLIDKIYPHNGHKMFKINNDTLEVSEAEYSNATYHLLDGLKKEVIVLNGYTYISALNKKKCH